MFQLYNLAKVYTVSVCLFQQQKLKFFNWSVKHTKYLESHLFEKAKKHFIITW